MNEKELWHYFWNKKVLHSKPLDRDFLWIKKEDFQPIKSNFSKEYNILQTGDSFRSQGYLRHIHVIDQGEYMLAHRDIGNVARFLPLGLIHFFFDVAPYMAFALVKGVHLKSIFTPPQY